MIGIERIVLYRKFTKDLRRFNKVLEKNQSWVYVTKCSGNATQRSLARYLFAAMRSAKEL